MGRVGAAMTGGVNTSYYKRRVPILFSCTCREPRLLFALYYERDLSMKDSPPFCFLVYNSEPVFRLFNLLLSNSVRVAALSLAQAISPLDWLAAHHVTASPQGKHNRVVSPAG
ncbi:hypothetical protein FKM82_022131 [Ascaphus truei]